MPNDMTKTQMARVIFDLRQELAAAKAELAELRKRRGWLARLARAVKGVANV